MSYDVKMYRAILEERLNSKRFNHSLNVAESAKELSERWGYENTEKAYVTGLLHDICKNDSEQSQLEMVRKSSRAVNSIDLITPPLYHAIAGAWYVENKLGIRDDEILDAIRYHTEGRANMTLLDKIIFTADIISADRDFSDVSHYRELAKNDLEQTVLEYLAFSIEDVLGKKICLSTHSINAYNSQIMHTKKG
ncbi:MAG: bis(5'-nucleosyl)-tetraphosphatase (symmetrical) YqeK [Ruminococcus sp.]|jgi:nicotinate-nucleotide adenylyltransferase|nr:bis(5'-nucleosyl)-tetraphosphatase (symmetrical) YqeK [Ruminococcus sp.]